MTQITPFTAQLGPGKTGLTIGYRVLNLDGSQYSAFTTTGVAETIPGTNRVIGGVEVPDSGGYIVVGESGTDLAEATVEAVLSGFSTHTAADVWAVGTRTVTGGTIDTNLDMRGTDDALLAADYTDPPSVAAINAEIVDALSVDTYAEPTTVPPATATIAQKIGWLFALARNKITQSATTQTLRNDADNANIGTSSVSDDGTTTTRGEWQ